MVTVPATLFGTLCFLYSLKRGKELNDDPEYQARLKDPEEKRTESTTATSLDEVLPTSPVMQY
ncbi:hypothetical protein O9929_15355 [Vibrio lentus]|nr:hypothetical protein [Vibrio lentus]